MRARRGALRRTDFVVGPAFCLTDWLKPRAERHAADWAPETTERTSQAPRGVRPAPVRERATGGVRTRASSARTGAGNARPRIYPGIGKTQRAESLSRPLRRDGRKPRMTLVARPVAMSTFRLRHYTVRVRRSERLRYRIARLLLCGIPLLLISPLRRTDSVRRARAHLRSQAASQPEPQT
jgi:hypothetical protein